MFLAACLSVVPDLLLCCKNVRFKLTRSSLHQFLKKERKNDNNNYMIITGDNIYNKELHLTKH